MLFIFFTGLRRQEAAKLKCEQVGLKAKTVEILDTKNYQNHVLLLSGFLQQLLERRRKSINTNYVFPGSGKGSYIIEPRRQIKHVIQETKFHFTVHDLRRTFITIAESLGISAYAVKRLANHKLNGAVTAGYIVTAVERLRKPMESSSYYLLQTMRLSLKVGGLKPIEVLPT